MTQFYTRHEALILLIAQSFFAGLAGAVMYAASNSLFLDQHGSERLAHVYITIAVVVSLFSFTFAALQFRLTLSALSIATCGLFVVIFLFSGWAVLVLNATWVSFALMVVFVLLVQLFGIIIGAQAGRLFDVSQVKKLFPLVLAGQVFGLIAGGFAIPLLIPLLGGVGQLLFFSGISMAVSMLCLMLTVKRFGSFLSRRPPRRRPGATPQLRKLLLKPFVLAIFAYQMLSAMGTKLVDFLFLDRADFFYQNPQQLAEFFGYMMAAGTLLALVFLVAAAGKLFSRFGMSAGLMVNPLVVALIVFAAVLVGAFMGIDSRVFFWIVVAAAVVDYILSIGMTDTAVNTSYQALPVEQRAAVQAAVQGVGVPLAFGFAGLLLLIFDAIEAFDLNHVVMLTIGIVLIWAVSGGQAFRQYSAELSGNLNRRTLNTVELSIDDASSLQVVERILAGSDRGRISMALDLLEEQAHPSLAGWLSDLLARDDPELVELALKRIEANRLGVLAPNVKAIADRPLNSAVDAAALSALSAVAPELALPRCLAKIEDPSLAIRETAFKVLLKDCGDEGRTVVEPLLEPLFASTRAQERQLVARVIGGAVDLENRNRIAALLKDTDPGVRNEALKAAEFLGHSELLPGVYENLADQVTRTAAMDVLATNASIVVPDLHNLLSARSQLNRFVIIRVIRAVHNASGPAIEQCLVDHLNHRDAQVRLQVLRSLAMRGFNANPTQALLVEEALHNSIAQAAGWMQCLVDLDNDAAFPLLKVALDEELNHAGVCSLYLVSYLLDEPTTVVSVAEKMTDGTDRDRAVLVETLDVSLSSVYRSRLLPLFESSSLAERLQKLSRWTQTQPMQSVERLEQLAVLGEPERSPWLSLCAIAAYCEYHQCTLSQILHRIPGDRGGRPVDVALELLGIPFAAGDGDIKSKEQVMLSTIERVAVLKSTSLFADTPSPVLASLGAVIEEVNVPAGIEFIHKGDTDDIMYIVVSGDIQVHDGSSMIVRLGAGSVLGELAVLDEGLRSTSATAIEDTHLFSIGKQAFEEIMVDRPEIIHAVVSMLCQRLRDTTASVADKSR